MTNKGRVGMTRSKTGAFLMLPAAMLIFVIGPAVGGSKPVTFNCLGYIIAETLDGHVRADNPTGLPTTPG